MKSEHSEHRGVKGGLPLARVSEWTLSGAKMCNADTSCRCRKSAAQGLVILTFL